jgi:hypothetical protein
MLNVLKLLILSLALAGLPLQGYAAVTMSYCMHGPADGTVQPDDPHAHHGDFHSGHTAAEDSGASCNDCPPCHLCDVFALPTPGALVLRESVSIFSTRPASPPDGFLPHQPRRPPLA